MQADTCVARVASGVGRGRGLPVCWHSYRGRRVELWRASDWQKRQNAVESQAEQTNSGAPGIYPAQTGTTRFEPMAGLVGRAFDLILVSPVLGPTGPSIPGRCPKNILHRVVHEETRKGDSNASNIITRHRFHLVPFPLPSSWAYLKVPIEPTGICSYSSSTTTAVERVRSCIHLFRIPTYSYV